MESPFEVKHTGIKKIIGNPKDFHINVLFNSFPQNVDISFSVIVKLPSCVLGAIFNHLEFSKQIKTISKVSKETRKILLTKDPDILMKREKIYVNAKNLIELFKDGKFER